MTISTDTTALREASAHCAGEHRVAIVLDPEFGAALSVLAGQYHVWVIESPTNMPVVHAVWAATTPDEDADTMGPGVTAFLALAGEAPEVACSRIALDVDDHHGEFGHDPAWSEIRVIGVSLVPDLEELFREVGATQVHATSDGFVCYR